MSVENVKSFIEKVRKDKSLQAKVSAVHKQHADAEVAGLVKVASAAGLNFSAEDFNQVRGPKKPPKGELSDVTGQMTCTIPFDTGPWGYW